jgi:hypothetical protein
MRCEHGPRAGAPALAVGAQRVRNERAKSSRQASGQQPRRRPSEGEGQEHWTGVVSEDQFATERLYARDVITVDPGDEGVPAIGALVALIAAGDPPVLFGLGNVIGASESGQALVRYRTRALDEPPPLPANPAFDPTRLGLRSLSAATYARLANIMAGVDAGGAGRTEWFVSVALPIEAATRAEAVREFWTYVQKLGPRELPAYVWPRGDELAMQAFVLGAVTNLDPEEDD